MAWQMAVTIKRIDSLGNLIAFGVIPLTLLLWPLRLLAYVVIEARKKDDLSVMGFFGPAVVGGAIILCAISVVLSFADIWNWIGVFNPQLALVRDLYLRVI